MMEIFNKNLSTRVVVSLFALLLFAGLWLVWYTRYYYVLQWLEGYSYFSDTSDFIFLSVQMPTDLLRVVGAYLIQFFYYPVVGAMIQAFLPVLVFLAGAVVLVSLFQNASKLLWVALLPVVYVAGIQFRDFDLSQTLGTVCLSWVLALVVYFLSWKKRQAFHLPAFLQNKYVSPITSVLLLGCIVYQLGFKSQEAQIHAYYCELECLTDEKKWDEILQVVPPEAATESYIARRFALLALLEKGQLTQEMFRYGVESDEDFWFYKHEEPLCRHFNALLFRSLNMPNDVVVNTYQQQIQSTFGTNFNVIRRLADTYLQAKNYPLAKKYLDLLDHSTVMKHWAEERRPQLEKIKHCKPVFEQRRGQFYYSDLMVAMSEMSNRYPQDHKYADLLLGGLLARKNMSEFYYNFQIIANRLYAQGEPIPQYYQEALMLIATKDPSVVQKYHIDAKVQEAFRNVMEVMKRGEGNQLKKLLPNSYWAYFL